MSWEGVGVIVSLLGLLLTWRHSRRSREIAEEALDIEKRREEAEKERRERQQAERKKANFSVRAGKGIAPNWNDHSIAVENSGPGTARNIRVFIDGEPAEESEFLVPGKVPEPGITRSPADPPLYFPYAPHMGSPQEVTVKIVWDDGFDSGRSREVPLQV